jgi:hypothetical protein
VGNGAGVNELNDISNRSRMDAHRQWVDEHKGMHPKFDTDSTRARSTPELSRHHLNKVGHTSVCLSGSNHGSSFPVLPERGFTDPANNPKHYKAEPVAYPSPRGWTEVSLNLSGCDDDVDSNGKRSLLGCDVGDGKRAVFSWNDLSEEVVSDEGTSHLTRTAAPPAGKGGQPAANFSALFSNFDPERLTRPVLGALFKKKKKKKAWAYAKSEASSSTATSEAYYTAQDSMSEEAVTSKASTTKSSSVPAIALRTPLMIFMIMLNECFVFCSNIFMLRKVKRKKH